jgi:hypothetical protein
MKEATSLRLFPPTYSITYALLYAYQQPVFIYFPKIAAWGLHQRPPNVAGPGMLYYGWIAAALLVGFLFSVVTPRRWAQALPQWCYWLPSVLAMGCVLYHERIWFLP